MITTTLQRVINASGIVLHAELAQLSSRRTHAPGYVKDFQLSSSGNYYLDEDSYRNSIQKLLNVPGIAVTNETAAVFLVVQELASGGEVLLSTQELSSLAEKDRFLNVIHSAGATPVEVGSEAAVTIQDYENALSENSRLILRLHSSVTDGKKKSLLPLETLSRLGLKAAIPVYEALGNGCLVDLNKAGICEMLIQQSLTDGATLSSFSCDQFLGGPQASLIVGNPSLIQRIGKNPMYPALQPPALSVELLAGVLNHYLQKEEHEIPTLWMIQRSSNEIRARAIDLAEGIDAEVIPGHSLVGNHQLPTWLVVLQGDATEWDGYLRRNDPPIFIHTENNQAVIDLRTVFPEEEPLLRKALQARD